MFLSSDGFLSTKIAFYNAVEAFAVACGWTIVAGSGTNDFVISSTGESGLLNKLFVRINEIGTGANANVRDDAAGTHVTTENSVLQISDTTIFYYALAGDKDYLFIFAQCGVIKRSKYVGLIQRIPTDPGLALDETHGMISCFFNLNVYTCKILRNLAGVWDQAINVQNGFHYGLRGGATYPDIRFALGFTRVGDNKNIVGTLKNVCTMEPSMGISNDIAYSVVSDSVWRKEDHVFFLVSGTPPYLAYEEPDSFIGMSRNTVSRADLYDNLILPVLSTNRWAIENNEGVSGFYRDKYFHSTGEDGLSDIHIRLYFQTIASNLDGQVVDSTKAHVTTVRTLFGYSNGVHYAFSDKDGFGLHRAAISSYLGKCWNISIDDSHTPNTDYLVVHWVVSNAPAPPPFYARKLRSAVTNQWYPATGDDDGTSEVTIDGVNTKPSSVNIYSNKVLLFPFVTRHPSLGNILFNTASVGIIKHIFVVNGAVVDGDLINIGGEQYIIGHNPANANYHAFRIA